MLEITHPKRVSILTAIFSYTILLSYTKVGSLIYEVKKNSPGGGEVNRNYSSRFLIKVYGK